jgi:hypothetical protein
MKPRAKSRWSPASSELANSLRALNAAAPPGIRNPTPDSRSPFRRLEVKLFWTGGGSTGRQCIDSEDGGLTWQDSAPLPLGTFTILSDTVAWDDVGSVYLLGLSANNPPEDDIIGLEAYLGSQYPVLCGQIFVPQQKFLVYGSGDVRKHANPNHSRASLNLIVEPGLYMLLRFQKAAVQGNYEAGNFNAFEIFDHTRSSCDGHSQYP